MTATITISCPHGIVMAADCRITFLDKRGNVIFVGPNPVQKIMKFKETNVGASYWGYYEGPEFGSTKTIEEILIEFDNSIVNKNDDVNTISEKLEDYFKKTFPKFKQRIGIHLAGYCKSDGDLIPILRHVFHGNWNNPGEFVNEKSNYEYHSLDEGKLTKYPYNPFHALFNGDNTIANLFFEFLPSIYPKRERQIILESLSLEQCIDLAKLTILTSSEILDFLTEMDKPITAKQVEGLMMATITKDDGFKFLKKCEDNKV